MGNINPSEEERGAGGGEQRSAELRARAGSGEQGSREQGAGSGERGEVRDER